MVRALLCGLLFLICVMIVTLVVIYIRTLWYSAMNGLGQVRGSKPGLSESDIQKLPAFVCIRREGEEEGEGGGKNTDGLNTIKLPSDLQCTVCLDSFHRGEKCLQIPACDHILHAQCADAWLSRCSVCPVCRSSARAEVRTPCPSHRAGHCETSAQTRPDDCNSSCEVVTDFGNPSSP